MMSSIWQISDNSRFPQPQYQEWSQFLKRLLVIRRFPSTARGRKTVKTLRSVVTTTTAKFGSFVDHWHPIITPLKNLSSIVNVQSWDDTHPYRRSPTTMRTCELSTIRKRQGLMPQSCQDQVCFVCLMNSFVVMMESRIISNCFLHGSDDRKNW